MLNHPTIEKLHVLRLAGMARALQEQAETMNIDALSFEERLGLLVDRELTDRENRRLKTRLRKARLRQAACLEDIDYRHPRGLDKGLLQSLASCRWLREHHNVLIAGPTGVGKTYIACALAQQACREGYNTAYLRLSKLFRELAVARGDGRFSKLLAAYAKTDLLVIDDWGLAAFTDEQRRDLLEIIEDRHGLRSTLVASQLPVDHWHEVVGNPTLADAILDRLVHDAYRIELKGESMRKARSSLTPRGEEQ
jgi:DNA replication protein DnaC